MRNLTCDVVVVGAGPAGSMTARFAAMSPKMNAVFSKLFPFHPATARAYNFTPSVP